MRHSLAGLIVLVVGPLHAQERTHDITPDDYFTLATITQLAASPDGKHIVYAEARWERSDDLRKTDLWLVASDGQHSPRRLTGDRANDRNPKWSSDGDAIYFLGNRKRMGETKPPYDGSAQVWKVKLVQMKADDRLALDALEPTAVTKVEGGVTGFDLASAAGAIFYSVIKTHSDKDAFSELRAKFDKVEYGHGVRKVSEIHRLDLATWRTEKLIDETRYVREFAVTRDGKRVAMISAFDDTVVKSEGESRVDVWESGKIDTPPTDVYRSKAASPYAWLQDLAWRRDGKRFAFCAIYDAYPAEIVVGTQSESTWKMALMDRPKDRQVRGYGSPLLWSQSTLLYLSERDGSVNIREAFGQSSWGDLHQTVVSAFSTSPDRAENPYVLMGGPTQFPVLMTSASRIAEAVNRTLVDPNAHTRTWKLPKVEYITWKAPDGVDVGGVLELPHDHKPGEKLPLVVAIHGGPTTSTKALMDFDPHNGRLYFAARGYAVLLPNYRGSTGNGDKFVTDLIGKENDIEVKDIVTGIQHLAKQGIVDPERVGVMGWSNGGYLTNCLITLKDSPIKFKAASSGAGILDTVAEWGFNDEPAYPIVFKKGLPWEQPDIYRKTSPTYGIANVTTPTLIHVGGGDERCPPGHSRMLYRALKEYKKVPTELVVYTGEPHGLTKMSNRKAKMEWDLAWFEKYLKRATKE